MAVNGLFLQRILYKLSYLFWYKHHRMSLLFLVSLLSSQQFPCFTWAVLWVKWMGSGWKTAVFSLPGCVTLDRVLNKDGCQAKKAEIASCPSWLVQQGMLVSGSASISLSCVLLSCWVLFFRVAEIFLHQADRQPTESFHSAVPWHATAYRASLAALLANIAPVALQSMATLAASLTKYFRIWIGHLAVHTDFYTHPP